VRVEDFSKTFLESYQPQTFEWYCIYIVFSTI